MRKVINIAALMFFIWLALDVCNIPNILLNFLLVGAIPGTTATVSPNVMLGLTVLTLAIIVFWLAARRVEILWRILQHLLGFITKHRRLFTK